MVAQPGIASRLIGRQSELAVIQGHIDAALAGQGGLLLLSGEAGVGKSRLVTELLEGFNSAAPDGLALVGNCFEGDRALAYAPLLDMLRAYWSFQQHVEPEQLFAPDLAAFVTLLPELQARIPGVQPFLGSAPEQEKQRIFQALLGMFARLADDRPLLMVFEDLHWSDETSLEFLVQLARSTQRSPILLIGTFRSDEEHSGLQRTLVELERGRLSLELQIGQLTIDEVDLLLRGIFEQPYSIRPDFLHAIYALTEGNPFFVEETIRSLIAAGDIYRSGSRWTRKDLAQLRIPRSVQDALTRRTEGLDSAALQVLESAAVIGQRFEFTLVQRLTDLPESDLLDVLRALIDAGLVREETADRFRFRHALVRESVYERLLARERRTRHVQVAEALEELHADMPDPWLGEFAYHFHAAERWDKAFQYTTAAGERAQSLFAPHAAVEHFTHALEAADRFGRTPPARLLRQRGRAYEVLGEFEAARRDFDAALDFAETEDDRREEWEALVDLGRSWEGLDYERAGSWFVRAQELARELDDPAALAHSLNRVGTWYVNSERIDQARAAHLEALSIFEEIKDEPGIAATVDYLGMVADLGGNLIEMRAFSEQAAEMFERLGDLQRLSSVLGTMTSLRGALVFDAVVMPTHTSPSEALGWGTRALQVAREIGWRAGEAYAFITLALVHLARADYSRALQLATEAHDVSSEIDHQEWLTAAHLTLGGIYADLLLSEPAIEHLGSSVALARASGSLMFLHIALSTLVDALIEQGNIKQAEEALGDFSPDLAMQTIGHRRLWATRANWELTRGNTDEALTIVDHLFMTGHNVTHQRDIPLLATLRGRALMALDRHAEAEEAFLAAQAGNAALNQPGKLWRVNLELARFYHSQERAGDARQALRAAGVVVARIAPGIPDETLREDFRSKAGKLFDEIDGGAVTRPETPDALLTPRENEVARLLARGLSNRRIADELFIGERTVETHVGNILSKLGFASRTQIAAWVHETSTRRSA